MGLFDLVDDAFNGLIQPRIDQLERIVSRDTSDARRTPKAKAKRGDIICVSRGAYEHYAIYVSKQEVIHYIPPDSGLALEWDLSAPTAHVSKTGMKRFLDGASSFKVVEFSDAETRKRKTISAMDLGAGIIGRGPLLGWDWLASNPEFHLYSAAETVKRAKSKLGEADYHLVFNNCEHFAVWCKTGMHRSEQVERALGLTRRILVGVFV